MKNYLGGKGSNNLSISQFVDCQLFCTFAQKKKYYEPPAGASLQLVPNSKFSPRPTCPTRLTCPSPPNPLSLLNPLNRPTCPTIQNSLRTI